MLKSISGVVCSVLALVGCLDGGPQEGPGEIDSEASALHRAEEGVTFENVSALLAPFARSATGEGLGGIAWLDYDNDGNLDLYLTNGVGASNGLFRNNGDGTFTDVTAAAGVSTAHPAIGAGSGASGVLAGDIDNDGFTDLFITGEGHLVGPAQTPNRMFHNQGNGSFQEIPAPSHPGSALGASFGDINNDGFVDLFVASPGHIPFLTGPGTGESHPNKLYLNNGDLTFTDISASAGIEGLYPAPWDPGLTVSDGACVSGFTDYDQDGDADLLVGNCNAWPPGGPAPVRPTPFNLFRNNGDNTFTDVAAAAGLATPPGGFWMGLAFGDYDNDGDVDFFATSTGTLNGLLHVLMSNNGDGTFTNNAAAAGVASSEFGWGATMADFDNDGDLDLYQVGSLPLFGAIGPGLGGPGRLNFNNGDGTFTDDTAATGVNLSFHYTSGVVQGDFDGDGFADIVVMTAPWQAVDPATGAVVGNPDGRPVLLRNEGNRNHSVTLKLVGTDSNAGGIGARVQVRTGWRVQTREVRAGSSMASTDSPWPSFGIGRWHHALVKVSWPSGLEERFFVRHGRVRTLTEGTGHRRRSHRGWRW